MRQFLNRLSPLAIARGRDDDPRMGRLFTDDYAEARVVLIGFPFDEGCTRNGGRPGASQGPKAFRRFVTALGPIRNPEHNIDITATKVFDLGDVVAEASSEGCNEDLLERSHALLEDAVFQVLCDGKVPFIVGGGNDQSAPNGRGALRFLSSDPVTRSIPLGVINIDAHLDVRPRIGGKVHSGTPFREFLEDERTIATGGGARFVEFGCQGQQCSAEHSDFVKMHGGTLMWLTKLANNRAESFAEALTIAGEKCFVSFDIDAVQGSDCPGVSCPGTVGLTAAEAIEISRMAGRNVNTLLMDISELNPAVEDYRSPRLAVMMFYHFLLGLATRP